MWFVHGAAVAVGSLHFSFPLNAEPCRTSAFLAAAGGRWDIMLLSTNQHMAHICRRQARATL